MPLKRTLSASFVLLVTLTVAAAQRARFKNSAAAIPPATLLQIVRAEDERRWDDSLKSLLSSNDAPIRKRAALAAGRIGNEQAVPSLTDMLMTDRDPDVRQMAAFALGEIESPGGAYALVTVLKEPGRPGRARAIEALGKIVAALPSNAANSGTKQDDDRLDTIKAAILDALRFEDGRRETADRLTILLGLTAVLRARPDGAGPVVTRFLDYSDPAIIATALNTMARLRLKEANERVRQLLNHNDPIVRANAARVIGAAEHKEAFDEVLARALNDSDLRVRVSAIRALGGLKDQRAVQPLLDRGRLLSRAAGLSHSGPAGEQIGVPECDAFITQYDACISSKVPEPARAQYQKAMDQWRTSWKKIAENPQTRRSLANACQSARKQQEISLKAYGCSSNQQNELLEIVSIIGNLSRNSKSATTYEWLGDVRDGLKSGSPEVDIALARIDPERYVTETPRADLEHPAAVAQGLREIATIKKTQTEVEKAATTLPSWLHRLITCSDGPVRGKCLNALDVSPFLQTYAAFQPADLSAVLGGRIKDDDVVVRATAAELLGDLPPSEMNTAVLIEALPRALRDKDLNDAALAVLGALGKQKSAAANAAIKTALDSPDHLVRRRAVALLKTNGVGDFSDRIPPVKTRNTLADYRRALGRTGRKPTATVITDSGSFTIEFLPDDAPLTIDNFIQLARRGYFNGQTIPRVVPNFVIQAGDPRGDQNGGPGYSIRCEINEVPYERASVGMALSGKDTGGSQWFVTHSPQPHLDGGYTVFGRVIRGMDVVDSIVRGDKIRQVIVNER
jgi:cyclophilin family peptidyl-prolyl cis-trans isomerase/HEAT repeat protein